MVFLIGHSFTVVVTILTVLLSFESWRRSSTHTATHAIPPTCAFELYLPKVYLRWWSMSKSSWRCVTRQWSVANRSYKNSEEWTLPNPRVICLGLKVHQFSFNGHHWDSLLFGLRILISLGQREELRWFRPHNGAAERATRSFQKTGDGPQGIGKSGGL